jgi:WD40 repeat protein
MCTQFILLDKEEDKSPLGGESLQAQQLQHQQQQSQQQQPLKGHASAVTCASWSAAHSKLSTGDADGTVIVWVLKEGSWSEEMVNKR